METNRVKEEDVKKSGKKGDQKRSTSDHPMRRDS